MHKAGIVAATQELIGGAASGDSVVITYSGHGTFVPDTSGDEPDARDEALCPYDIDKGNVLLDDEIQRKYLPGASYPQTPQIIGPKRNRRFKALA